jgi:hypothetical protein
MALAMVREAARVAVAHPASAARPEEPPEIKPAVAMLSRFRSA